MIVQTNGASPIKIKRRTKAEMQVVQDAIVEVVGQYYPMTVRQVFYQLVSRGVIDKTEKEYKSTVCRLLAKLRRNDTIPYSWIADNTRWMRKPRTYSNLEDMLRQSQTLYRRSVWEDQDCYVEVWLEKEALAGVLVDVTREWDVPLMVTRGYPSISFVHSAAKSLEDECKPCYLYYFGDRDPSGVDIDRFVEEQIREIAPDVDLHFQRVAVTVEQIEEMKLPTRPTKKTDSRAKNFKGESVEVDAIPPDVLRALCRDCIIQHIDFDTYERMQLVEEAEREAIAHMIENLEGE